MRFIFSVFFCSRINIYWWYLYGDCIQYVNPNFSPGLCNCPAIVITNITFQKIKRRVLWIFWLRVGYLCCKSLISNNLLFTFHLVVRHIASLLSSRDSSVKCSTKGSRREYLWDLFLPITILTFISEVTARLSLCSCVCGLDQGNHEDGGSFLLTEDCGCHFTWWASLLIQTGWSLLQPPVLSAVQWTRQTVATEEAGWHRLSFVTYPWWVQTFLSISSSHCLQFLKHFFYTVDL